MKRKPRLTPFLITLRCEDDKRRTHTRFQVLRAPAIDDLLGELIGLGREFAAKHVGKSAPDVTIEPASKYRLSRRRMPRPVTYSRDAVPERIAVEYARWLAKRDGIGMPTHPATPVKCEWSGVESRTRTNQHGNPVFERRIVAVCFGLVRVPIPNWDWQPDEPVEDIIPDTAEAA